LTDINDKTPESIPASFQLNQNYPNPFNPSTKIKFSVPKQSSIRIIIYDLLGRRVKTLLDEERPAGNYTVQWNGENEFNNKVSSGIYFYSFYALSTDKSEYKSIKKMILLK
jgi:flagellar hook assembly protein FlgD